ncbi:hypothetical protein ABN180_01350 [Klebsiella pneumoniae]
MDKFDRKLQREILQACVDSYPAAPLLEQFNLTEVAECAESNIQKLLANINYLCEHGLIKNHSSIILNDHSILTRITATAKGIDFMLNDGGLSAILNVQTIKLHRDAVVVLEDLIAISNMNDEQKEKAKSALGELPTEALKAMVQAAVAAGLSKLLGQ